MREILFKAKRLSDGEWVEGYPVYDRADCTLKRQGKCQCAHDGSLITFFGWIDNLYEYDEVEVDPATVCQYTGLTDKNGKKIFEGDIVTTDLKRPYLIVEFRDACFMFNCNDGDKDYYDIFLPITDVAHEEYQYGEIIGNIHDGEGGQHEDNR